MQFPKQTLPHSFFWYMSCFNHDFVLNFIGYLQHLHLKGDRVVFIHAFDPPPMQSARHCKSWTKLSTHIHCTSMHLYIFCEGLPCKCPSCTPHRQYRPIKATDILRKVSRPNLVEGFNWNKSLSDLRCKFKFSLYFTGKYKIIWNENQAMYQKLLWAFLQAPLQ